MEAVWGLGVDAALPNHATECLLQVRSWTAEAVVQVEMAEGGIEVIAPQQADHPPTEPDTFWIACRAGNLPAGFCKFIDPSWRAFTGLGRSWSRLGVAALGERRRKRKAEKGGA